METTQCALSPAESVLPSAASTAAHSANRAALNPNNVIDQSNTIIERLKAMRSEISRLIVDFENEAKPVRIVIRSHGHNTRRRGCSFDILQILDTLPAEFDARIVHERMPNADLKELRAALRYLKQYGDIELVRAARNGRNGFLATYRKTPPKPMNPAIKLLDPALQEAAGNLFIAQDTAPRHPSAIPVSDEPIDLRRNHNIPALETIQRRLTELRALPYTDETMELIQIWERKKKMAKINEGGAL